MPSRRLVLVPLILLLAGHPARAVGCDLSKPISAEQKCYEGARKAAEDELARLWERVLLEPGKSSHMPRREREQWKSRLRESNRTWIAHIEKDCEDVVPFEWYGGGGADAATAACRAAKTRTRIDELKQRYGFK